MEACFSLTAFRSPVLQASRHYSMATLSSGKARLYIPQTVGTSVADRGLAITEPLMHMPALMRWKCIPTSGIITVILLPSQDRLVQDTVMVLSVHGRAGIRFQTRLTRFHFNINM